MAIVIFCPRCKVRLTLGDERAGSDFACPRCEAPIRVPKLLPSAPPPRPAASPSSSPRSAPPPLPPVIVHQRGLDEDSEDQPWEVNSPPRQGNRPREPSGIVNAVAIMYLVCGLLNVVCGVLLLAAGAFAVQLVDLVPELGRDPEWRLAGPIIAGIAGVLAVITILLGVPALLAAYGIWHRRYWGYVLGLVLAGINILFALASVLLGDPCSVFLCGSCGIFALVVLCNPRYVEEFS